MLLEGISSFCLQNRKVTTVHSYFDTFVCDSNKVWVYNAIIVEKGHGHVFDGRKCQNEVVSASDM